MTKTKINYEEDARQELSEFDLKQISLLAELQVRLEESVGLMESALKTEKEKLRQVQEVDLPEAMRRVGMESFKLLNGKQVTLKSDITMSVPKDERFAEVVKWLEKVGLGDLLTDDVIVRFGKGEIENAAKLIGKLEEDGYEAKEAFNVNTASLKAAVREFLETGKEVPLELLGAYRWTKAMIK